MSTYEYKDLFLKAQANGKYNMFVFDIVNSKMMDTNTRLIADKKMKELMLKMYSAIKEIEIKTNKKIIIDDDGIVSYYSHDYKNVYKGFGMLIEPFVYGDTFGFTIYRDSFDKNAIYNLYEFYKKELEIDFEFHAIDGYYETNKWEEGNLLFFRGYCIDMLSNYHKSKKNLNK